MMNKYLEKAIELAKHSPCKSSKCGCVIVNKLHGVEIIIGEGWSRPPIGAEHNCEKCYKVTGVINPKSDKHCCLHAEQIAMLDAIRTYRAEILKGSTIYFARLDLDNNFKFAGKPYCTVCSKLALELGVKTWFLYHKPDEGGEVFYKSNYYNSLSFNYKPPKINDLSEESWEEIHAEERAKKDNCPHFFWCDKCIEKNCVYRGKVGTEIEKVSVGARDSEGTKIYEKYCSGCPSLNVDSQISDCGRCFIDVEQRAIGKPSNYTGKKDD